MRRTNLPLLGIMFAAAVFAGYWSLRVREWGVMTDELSYVKLALNFGLPVIRGEYYGQFTPIYPLLIAPFYGFFDTSTAFRLAHGLNVAFMVSTAVPVYLLCRELSLPRLAGYCAALLAVFVPWMVFVNHLTTESVAYPAFAWALLAIVRTTAAPSIRRDLIALGAVAMSTLARTQFVVLGGVLVAAAIIHELAYRRVGRPLSSRRDARTARLKRLVTARPVLTTLVVIGGVMAVGLLATGGVGRGLGIYETTVQGDLLPHGISRTIKAHTALLVVNVFALPFLLGVAFGVAALLRPASKVEHAFTVVLGLSVFAIIFEAADFNLRHTGVIQERYAFYVVAPVFVAMVAYLVRPRLLILAVGVGALLVAWVLGTLNYAYGESYSFASPFYNVVQGRSLDIGELLGIENLGAAELTVVLALLAAPVLILALRLAPPSWALVGVGGLLFVSLAIETTYNFSKIHPTQDSSQARLGLDGDLARERGLNWVDDVLPDGASAAFAPAVVGSLEDTRKTWWDLEFWNKSVDRMYDYRDFWNDTPFPTEQLSLDWNSGVFRVATPRRYLVVPLNDRRFRPVGKTLATTSFLALIEAQLPLRAGWAVKGTNKDGWTAAGAPAVIRFFPNGTDLERRVIAEVQLTSTPDVKEARPYRILGGERQQRGVVEPRRSEVVRIGFCAQREGTDLTVRVKGSTTLLSGEKVGLAITAVDARTSTRCRPV